MWKYDQKKEFKKLREKAHLFFGEEEGYEPLKDYALHVPVVRLTVENLEQFFQQKLSTSENLKTISYLIELLKEVDKKEDKKDERKEDKKEENLSLSLPCIKSLAQMCKKDEEFYRLKQGEDGEFFHLKDQNKEYVSRFIDDVQFLVGDYLIQIKEKLQHQLAIEQEEDALKRASAVQITKPLLSLLFKKEEKTLQKNQQQPVQQSEQKIDVEY